MPAKVTNQSPPGASKMPTKLKLKLANECEDIASKVNLTTTKKNFMYHIMHSRNIDDKHINKMMDLFTPLMKEMYENSKWGWDEPDKLSEWKSSRTRVILVVNKDPIERGGPSIVWNKLPENDEQLIGFMCFRFEVGADKNESAFYVYELHINPEHQRQGLGKELMQMGRVIATAFKMDKIMLTVFRCNDIALKFYNDKLKFNLDKSTPAKNEADYMILSSKIKHWVASYLTL